MVDPFGGTGSEKLQNHLYKVDIYDYVRSRFCKYPEVILIRGMVPDILPLIPVQKIALLMIDMNGHEAEIAALKYFYDRVLPGGIIYFDDYGGRWPQLRRVVDDFMEDKPEKVLTFAAPIAMIVKM